MNFNYVPLGSFKPATEGKIAVAFQVSTEVAEIPELITVGLGKKEITQVRSIYINNPDLAGNLTVTVLSSGQVIRVPANSDKYVPLFSSMPCQLQFVADAMIMVDVIVANFDFDALKLNDFAAAANPVFTGILKLNGHSLKSTDLSDSAALARLPLASTDLSDSADLVRLPQPTIPLAGHGSPEGVVPAPVGSLYVNLDGGAATTLYVKTGGAATFNGWTAK